MPITLDGFFSSLSSIKSNIKNSIESKGQVLTNVPFDQYASAISNIQGGDCNSLHVCKAKQNKITLSLSQDGNAGINNLSDYNKLQGDYVENGTVILGYKIYQKKVEQTNTKYYLAPYFYRNSCYCIFISPPSDLNGLTFQGFGITTRNIQESKNCGMVEDLCIPITSSSDIKFNQSQEWYYAYYQKAQNFYLTATKSIIVNDAIGCDENGALIFSDQDTNLSSDNSNISTISNSLYYRNGNSLVRKKQQFVFVTEYKTGYVNNTQFDISGFTDHSDDEYNQVDLSQLDGTYIVTEETSNLKGNQRIYKHSGIDKYLYYRYSDSGMYSGWRIYQTVETSEYYFDVICTDQELESGDHYFGTEMGGGDTVTFANFVTQTVLPIVKVKSVDNFNEANNQWSYSSSASQESFNSYQLTPKVNGIYCKGNNGIYGDSLGTIYGNGLVIYTAGHTAPINLTNTYYSDTTYQYLKSEFGPAFLNCQYYSYESPDPKTSLATVDGVSAMLLSSEKEIGFAQTVYQKQEPFVFGYLPSRVYPTYTVSLAVHSNSSTEQHRIIHFGGEGRVKLVIDWSNSVVKLYQNNEAKITITDVDITTNWHVISYTFETLYKPHRHSNNHHNLQLFIDGIKKGTFSTTNIGDDSGDCRWLNIGDSNCSFYFCEVKVYQQVLTDNQILAQYNRVKALWI